MQPNATSSANARKLSTQHALGWCLVLLVIGVMIFAAVRGIPSAGGIEREPTEDAPPPEGSAPPPPPG